MSPKRARTKRRGDYVALRGMPDLKTFAHVLLVTGSSRASFTAVPPNSPGADLRFTFNTKAHMRMLRGAVAYEIEGYERQETRPADNHQPETQ